MKKLFITIGLLISLTASAAAEKEIGNPITELTAPDLTEAATKDATLKAPILVQDKEAAKKYLEGDTLKQVLKLDFTKKKVLIFYWAGSGRDQLSCEILESYPEQLVFNIQRGRTRDLRRHSKVYVIRKNVSYAPPK